MARPPLGRVHLLAQLLHDPLVLVHHVRLRRQLRVEAVHLLLHQRLQHLVLALQPLLLLVGLFQQTLRGASTYDDQVGVKEVGEKNTSDTKGQ